MVFDVEIGLLDHILPRVIVPDLPSIAILAGRGVVFGGGESDLND